MIGYTAIENGEIKDVDALGVGARDGITAAAVQGVNDKQTKVSFDGTTQYDITSDTVILYVDTDKHGYSEKITLPKWYHCRCRYQRSCKCCWKNSQLSAPA